MVRSFRITFYLVMISVVVILGLVLWARSVPRSQDLGVSAAGELASCDGASNCVSSMATNQDQFMEPWPYSGATEGARERLLLILRLLPNVKIIAEEETYLAAEFRVAQLFIDDVEFLIDPQVRVVHFRSASRIGVGDFGVNRKRMQRIGDAFKTSWPQQKLEEPHEILDPEPVPETETETDNEMSL